MHRNSQGKTYQKLNKRVDMKAMEPTHGSTSVSKIKRPLKRTSTEVELIIHHLELYSFKQ